MMEKCKYALKREFYYRMTRIFGWSKNVLIHQIENQKYQLPFLLCNVNILSMFQDYRTEFFKHTKNLRVMNTKLPLVRGLLLPKLIF